MARVPTNLIPTRITQLTVADNASIDGIIIYVYQGTTYQLQLKTFTDDLVGMQSEVYDPTDIEGDAFDMDNMVEGSDTLILTAAERVLIQHTTRTALNNVSGVNTGDQQSSDFNHDALSNITGTSGEYNHPSDAKVTEITHTNRTNLDSIDQDLAKTDAVEFLSMYIGGVSAGNYSEFEAGGTLKFNGDATVWEDQRFPLIAKKIDVASGRIDYNYINGVIEFAANARYPEEPVVMVGQMPHAALTDAAIHPHLHWVQTSSDIPNWLLAYRVLPNGATLTLESDWTNHTLTPLSSHNFTYISGSLMQISSFPDISTTGVGISAVIQYALFRDTGNISTLFAGADPIAGIAYGAEFDIHYQIDTMGSREEYVK